MSVTQTTEHTPMRETIYVFSNIHVEKDVHAHGLKQQSLLCQCADAQQQRAAMSGVGVGDWGGVSWSDSVTAASTAAVTHATPPPPPTPPPTTSAGFTGG